MTAIPAVVAGCPRVVIMTPPGPDGTCDAGTLVAAREAGVDEIYLSGGAQAIAAVAYGTETVPKCYKVVGPGSPWVVAGMQLCADHISPGPPAGPSESMVLADADADVERLALDLMIEAEHGPDSTTFLVTPSERVAQAVADRIAALADQLGEQRRSYVETVFSENGGLVVARDMDDAIAFANEFAAEHLQIASKQPWDVAARIVNAGEILLGQDAPFSMANFVIGVNAVLPTGGKARSASALGVMDYIKRISVAHVTPVGYDTLAAATEAFARYEGFDAHALAISARPK
jgi:histidinol dehydrogenase